MKSKVTIHYLLAFIIACSIIFLVNISFMRSAIYKTGGSFDYSPSEIMNTVASALTLSTENKVTVDTTTLKLLDEKSIGLQVLDTMNQEIFNYHAPSTALSSYSNVQLINLYNASDTTLFVGEKVLAHTPYTYLLFFDTDKVNRLIYTYNVNLLMQAHHFPILVGINIFLILALSLIFTHRITLPLKRMIDKIIILSQGNYQTTTIKAGIYYEIETCLNKLADTLDSNEKKRQQMDQMQEEWISNITHDIKTPLTSIMGNAEIISDTQYPLEDSLRMKYGHTILRKSEYIKTLVEDLNLSTRLKNNTLLLNKQQTNIVSLMRHVLIDIINDEKYNVENITFTYSHEDIISNVDIHLIKRVFINLIINAFVHNTSDVKLVIHIEKDIHNNIHISFHDNGNGVSQDELHNLFKRFYRGTHTRQKVEGSGLGMAIAHDIIKAHDFSIVASSTPGEGLLLDIYI